MMNRIKVLKALKVRINVVYNVIIVECMKTKIEILRVVEYIIT